MPKGEGFPPPPTSKAPTKTDDDTEETGPIEVNASAWTGGSEQAPKGKSWFNQLRDLVQKVEEVKQGPLNLDSSEGMEPISKEEAKRHAQMREEGDVDVVSQPMTDLESGGGKLSKAELARFEQQRADGDVELVTQPMINLEEKDNLKPWKKAEIAKFEKSEKEKAEREAESLPVRQARQGIEQAKAAGITRERNQMHTALEARSEAYKTFLRSEQAFKKIKKPSDEDKLAHAATKTALLHAENSHKASQLQMSTAMMESVKERLRLDGKDEAYIERVLPRYRGIVTFSEVHGSKAKMENEARLEVAGEKKKNIFEKGLSWYNNLNKSITDGLTKKLTGNKMLGFGKPLSEQDAARWARNGVRAGRMLGFATLGAGVGVLGGLGAGAVLGIALGKVGLGALNIGTGMAAGYGAGEVFDRTVGQKRLDAFTEARRAEMGSVTDIATVEATHAKGSKEALTASRLKYEHGAAFITGAGMSLNSLLQVINVESIRNAIDAVMDIRVGSVSGVLSSAANKVTEGSNSAASAAQTAGPSVEASPNTNLTGHNLGSEPPSPRGADVSVAETAPGAVSAPAEAVASVGEGHRLAISGNINNADRLVGHFGVQMQEEFAGKDAPKSVKALFEMLKTEEGASLLRGEDQATLKLKFQMPNGESAVMQPGDSLSLNAKGEIVFERPGHPELTQTLIDANGEVHEAKGFQMSGGVETVQAAPEVAKPAAHAEAPVSAPVVPEATPVVAETVTSAPVEQAAVAVETAPVEEQAPVAQEPVAAAEVAPVQQAPVVPEQVTAPEVAPVEQTPVTAPVETQTPAPEVAPVVEQAIPQAVEGAPFVNAHGVTVDPSKPGLYADEKGNLIAFGGTVEQRAQFALDYVQKRPEAQVYFDSSETSVLGEKVPHLSRVGVDPDSGTIQMPNEVMDPTLRGSRLPTANDLRTLIPPTP